MKLKTDDRGGKNGLRRVKWLRRACVCCAFAALTALFACSGGASEAAQAAFDRGAAAYNSCDMEAAKQAFAECCRLDGALYEDAKKYLDGIAEYERLYLQGVSAYERGDYNAASSAFLGIKGYLNSEDYLNSIDGLKDEYDSAVRLYEAGEYLKARAEFLRLGDYQRAAAYAANIDSMIGLYNEGIRLMNRSSFQNAARAFTAINTRFLDSDEMLLLCERMRGSETVKLGEFIHGYTQEYGGESRLYGGSFGLFFELKDSRGLIISGAMDESGVVRRISFCVSRELASILGRAEVESTFAHCIRALNPSLAAHAGILSGISDYLTEQGRMYGSMRVHLGSGEDGMTVLTAEYEPQGLS